MNVAQFVENKQLIQEAKSAAVRRVLKALQENAPLSLDDLVERTSLGPNTLTPTLLELMSNNLVSDGEGADIDFNLRKFSLKADPHLVAGLKLSNKIASVVIMDFAGNIIGDFSTAPPKPILDPDELVDFVKSILDDSLDKIGKSLDQLSAVGLGLPGLVDAEKGVVHWSPHFSKHNFSLKKALRDKIGADVFIDNDANLLALAEHRHGSAKGLRNFIVVSVETGIGLGVYANGEIYRGTHGRGAELGHIKVQIDGAQCLCGQRGCLEAYLGGYAVLNEAKLVIPLDTSLTYEEQMNALLEAADRGHVRARNILLRSGRMFAIGLANIVNILAPELIVLTTKRLEGNPDYLNALIDELCVSVTQMGGTPPDVVLNKWDEQKWALGAATLAVDRVTDAAIAKMSEHPR